MPRSIIHPDAVVLEACKRLALQGIDPTYRSLRSAGVTVCGVRLRQLRNDAIRTGNLCLPTSTRITFLQPRSQRKPEPEKIEAPKRELMPIPKNLRGFIKIERRIGVREMMPKVKAVKLPGGEVHLVIWFWEGNLSWKGTRFPFRRIRSVCKHRSSSPTGRFAWFESTAG